MSDKKTIGLSRLISLQQQVDSLARNVANQTTTAYKASHLKFQEYLTKASEDEVASSPMRSLVAVAPFVDFSAGALAPTGNPTDVAIIKDGFFVVDTPAGPRYTRAGSFTLNNEGRLVTLGGQPVVTSVGQLVVSQADAAISVGPDGSISTRLGPIARLRLVRFENTAALRAEGSGLFSSEAPAIDVAASQVRLATGVLETSNVKPVEEMSKLIAASRAYDLVAKVVFNGDDTKELKKLAGED